MVTQDLRVPAFPCVYSSLPSQNGSHWRAGLGLIHMSPCPSQAGFSTPEVPGQVVAGSVSSAGNQFWVSLWLGDGQLLPRVFPAASKFFSLIEGNKSSWIWVSPETLF